MKSVARVPNTHTQSTDSRAASPFSGGTSNAPTDAATAIEKQVPSPIVR